MAPSASDMIVDVPPGEPVMHLTRVLDAPRELVWETFTRPEHIARWWGPRRYTIAVHELDVRPGGKWRVSHSDGNKTIEFFGEFPPIEETYEFRDEGGKTKLICTQRFPNVMGRDMMAKSGAAEGGRESFERLDELLQESKGKK